MNIAISVTRAEGKNSTCSEVRILCPYSVCGRGVHRSELVNELMLTLRDYMETIESEHRSSPIPGLVVTSTKCDLLVMPEFSDELLI